MVACTPAVIASSCFAKGGNNEALLIYSTKQKQLNGFKPVFVFFLLNLSRQSIFHSVGITTNQI